MFKINPESFVSTLKSFLRIFIVGPLVLSVGIIVDDVFFGEGLFSSDGDVVEFFLIILLSFAILFLFIFPAFKYSKFCNWLRNLSLYLFVFLPIITFWIIPMFYPPYHSSGNYATDHANYWSMFFVLSAPLYIIFIFVKNDKKLIIDSVIYALFVSIIIYFLSGLS